MSQVSTERRRAPRTIARVTPLPEATRQTVVRLRFVARTLDRAAARMRPTSDVAGITRMMAGNVWHAIDRIEDLAMIVEDFAPPLLAFEDDEP